MASLATACRHTARAAARSLRARGAQSRDINTSRPQWAASNFVMPAMSPTMTEGNIASWKVKEGDSFSTGDVLLEIETDKAQMDVEAQDDGVVAKIVEQDGAKAVKVGKRIAVLAEPGDDLSTLSIPSEDLTPETSASSSSSSSSKDDSTAREEQKQQSTRPADHHAPATPSQPQKYPLYPSVQHLLHLNNIPISEANSIPATGPNGRLLKGDALAYLGRISKNYSSDQAARLGKLSHLDLSNIKPATRKPASCPAAPSQPQKSMAKSESPEETATQIALPISFSAVFATQARIQESLGLTLPLATFIARASEIANESLPRAQGSAATSDELFDAVLGLDVVKGRAGKATKSKGQYKPMITALPPRDVAPLSSQAIMRSEDVLDVLTGARPRSMAPRRMPGAAGVGSEQNVFSLSVGKGEEKRARTYLERVKTVLEREPGSPAPAQSLLYQKSTVEYALGVTDQATPANLEQVGFRTLSSRSSTTPHAPVASSSSCGLRLGVLK